MSPQLFSKVCLHQRLLFVLAPKHLETVLSFFFFFLLFPRLSSNHRDVFFLSKLRMLILIKLAQQCLVLLIADFLLDLKLKDLKHQIP